jgi:cytochrome c-type biogenesis protein CcmE
MAARKKRQRIPLVKATASEILAAYDHIYMPPEVKRAAERGLAEAREITARRAARKRSAKSRAVAAK